MRVRIIANRRLLLRLAVDDPFGIEDLVPAMLGVRLREHHELDVGRVAAERAEARDEIVDLVGRERKPELRVGAHERIAALRQQRDASQAAAAGNARTARSTSSSESNTVSVMRSCSSGSERRAIRRVSGAPSRVATWKATPRSMRSTAASPQWCAISVAFDDQGEIVPGRGTRRRARPRLRDRRRADRKSAGDRASRALRQGSGRSMATKCQYSAEMEVMQWPGRDAASAAELGDAERRQRRPAA